MKKNGTNVIDIATHRTSVLKAKFCEPMELPYDKSVLVKALIYACAVSSAGDKELIDSGRPYLRIHNTWGCDVDNNFRVEVSCGTKPIAEWTTRKVSKEETQSRIKPKNNKIPKIPWDKIQNGLHWYSELDTNSDYWKILEPIILKTPLENFTKHSFDLDARSESVEALVLKKKRRSNRQRN